MVATSEGRGRPCYQSRPTVVVLLLSSTQHKQIINNYSALVHTALGGGWPRWQPLNGAVQQPCHIGETPIGESPGGQQWQWWHTVATGRRRRPSFDWEEAGGGNGRTARPLMAMDTKLCDSRNLLIFSLFNRLFHSNRPVKNSAYFYFKNFCVIFSSQLLSFFLELSF